MKSPLLQIAALLFVTSMTLEAQAVTRSPKSPFQPPSMNFTLPPGFVPTAVAKNPDVLYDYAIRPDSGNLEIRYRIWPEEKGRTSVPLDMMVRTMALNIGNGKAVEPQYATAEDARKEFNADAGCAVVVPVDSDFGKGYKYCLIWAVRKNGVGDAYIFFLYSESVMIANLFWKTDALHALRFQ